MTQAIGQSDGLMVSSFGGKNHPSSGACLSLGTRLVAGPDVVIIIRSFLTGVSGTTQTIPVWDVREYRVWSSESTDIEI